MSGFIGNYDGDWGTRELVKTCAKHFAHVAIKAGEHKPQYNYTHPAQNSTKRNPNGPHGSKLGKAALRRRAEDNQTGDLSPHPSSPTNSTLPLPVNRGTDWLTPQPQPESQELNGRLAATTTRSPYTTHPHSTAEPTMIFPGLLSPPIVGRQPGYSPFVDTRQAQELNDHARYLPAGTYTYPRLDQPLAGPSQDATTGLHFHPGQVIQNPAFMEDLYQFKQDRSPSPSWNTNKASGSSSHYEPRCN